MSVMLCKIKQTHWARTLNRYQVQLTALVGFLNFKRRKENLELRRKLAENYHQINHTTDFIALLNSNLA